MNNLALRLNLELSKFISASTTQIYTLLRQMAFTSLLQPETTQTTFYANQKILFWMDERRAGDSRAKITGSDEVKLTARM